MTEHSTDSDNVHITVAATREEGTQNSSAEVFTSGVKDTDGTISSSVLHKANGEKCSVELSGENSGENKCESEPDAKSTQEADPFRQFQTTDFSSVAGELYDDNIAEIYLEDFNASLEKGKTIGSDSALSEMSNSFGNAEEDKSEPDMENGSGDSGESVNMSVNETNTDKVKREPEKQPDSLFDDKAKKRPLSPDCLTDIHSEVKRLKTEDNESKRDSTETDNTEKNDDESSDFCPPVAIVAPLGFGEEIFIESSPVKGEQGDLKNDISSLLDSLDQDDDKNVSFIDSEFEKLKSDLFAGHSFKTLDGHSWTFDAKSSNSQSDKNKIKEDDLKGNSVDKNEVKTLTNQNGGAYKKFTRAISVENEIEDFEKVLNNVMKRDKHLQNGNGNIRHVKSERIAYLPKELPGSFPKCHQDSKKPCSHVSNSDLLRELLDQKTDNTNAQSKTRHEIDLSFLKPDLISGKGLSVSSDKILQTRTIDPRLTSIPHIERSLGPNRTISFPAHPFPSGVQSNTSQNRNTDNDHISLAEQRRASITLHHKVPKDGTFHSNPTSPFQDTSDEGTSNIIKEAFDFATELSDKANEVNAIPHENTHLGRQVHNQNSTTGSLFCNTQTSVSPFDPNFPSISNQYNARSRSMRGVQPGNQALSGVSPNHGLLTFADTSAVQSQTDHPPQLSGPFLNSTNNVLPNTPEVITNGSQSFASKQESLFKTQNFIEAGGVEEQPLKGTFDLMQHTFSKQAGYAGHPDFLRTAPMQNNSNMTNMHLNPSQSAVHPSQSAGHPSQSAVHPSQSAGHPSQSAGHPSTGYSGNRFRDASSMPLRPEDRLGMRATEKVNYLNQMERNVPYIQENSLRMGMQERIRAMNVQQWYRRRMQAQMNAQANYPTGQHLQNPMTPGAGVSSRVMMPNQGNEYPHMTQGHRQGAMQPQYRHANSGHFAGSSNPQRFNMPHSMNQVQFDNQSARVAHYQKQLSYQNRITNQAQVQPQYPGENQGNGVLQEAFSPPSSETFPFNI